MPVAICSTPKSCSTGIPDECPLQSVPGSSARAISGPVTSGGIAGSVRGKKCQSHGTGTPASSQCPDGVSLPRDTSVAAAPGALGRLAEPRQVDIRGGADRAAQPEPRQVRHPQRPAPAVLGAAGRAGLHDMPERVGARVAEGGGVRRAAAADRIHHQQERARHQAIRSMTSGRHGRRRLPDRVCRPDPRRRGREPRRVRRVDACQRRARARPTAPSPSSCSSPTAWSIASPCVPPPAAELDHRNAERRACRWRSRIPRARRSPRRSPARPRRCASKSSRKPRGPPSAATIRSNRSAAAPEAKARRIASAPASRPAASPAWLEDLGAERDRHVVEPAVDRVAAQEARRVRHLERVAGRRRQRLVHVGDERPRSRQPAPVATSTSACGQRPRRLDRRP